MIKESFKAPDGYVYVNHTLHLFGEVIYSTDKVEYKQDDFELIRVEDLQDIIEKWRSK